MSFAPPCSSCTSCRILWANPSTQFSSACVISHYFADRYTEIVKGIAGEQKKVQQQQQQQQQQIGGNLSQRHSIQAHASAKVGGANALSAGDAQRVATKGGVAARAAAFDGDGDGNTASVAVVTSSKALLSPNRASVGSWEQKRALLLRCNAANRSEGEAMPTPPPPQQREAKPESKSPPGPAAAPPLPGLAGGATDLPAITPGLSLPDAQSVLKPGTVTAFAQAQPWAKPDEARVPQANASSAFSAANAQKVVQKGGVAARAAALKQSVATAASGSRGQVLAVRRGSMSATDASDTVAVGIVAARKKAQADAAAAAPAAQPAPGGSMSATDASETVSSGIVAARKAKVVSHAKAPSGGSTSAVDAADSVKTGAVSAARAAHIVRRKSVQVDLV